MADGYKTLADYKVRPVNARNRDAPKPLDKAKCGNCAREISAAEAADFGGNCMTCDNSVSWGEW
jgi:hypothetical protein